MKRILCGVMIGASLLAAGCGRQTTVVSTPEGKVQVNKGNNQVTITTKQGTESFGTNNVSEGDLGVPFYPGAKQQGGLNVSTHGGSNSGSFAATTLITKDPVDKVVAFYKSKLPSDAKLTSMNGPKMQMAMFDEEAKGNSKGFHVQIMADSKKGETDISIMAGSGNRH